LRPSDVLVPKDKANAISPLRCPICDGSLEQVMIRDLGGITADINWQLHAGHCPEHGWFQCEVIATPPREIFPVDRPFGSTRKVVIDGVDLFAFATVWNDVPLAERLKKIDPFDRTYWKVRHQVTSRS